MGIRIGEGTEGNGLIRIWQEGQLTARGAEGGKCQPRPGSRGTAQGPGIGEAGLWCVPGARF